MKFSSEILTIPGAPLEGENPLPKFRARKPSRPEIAPDLPDDMRVGLGTHIKVLPYTMQDRYSRKRIPLKLKCLVLENEYLRAQFLPEYGGRLHSLYDKVNGQELLFTNTVIQPGNLAIRNAWLSGGIEWNIGSLGHTFTTCDNVFVAKLEDGEGNTFIRIYEFERLKSIFWQVDFHLPEGSKHLITHVRMVNPFPTDTTTYWWSNVAVPDNGKTRILASGKNVLSFADGKMNFEALPYLKVMPGDASYPSMANRSYDFFIQPNFEEECTWEASAYDNGVVFYERSTPPLSAKKLYCWGTHPAGVHWQEFLSEPGKGYYAEIQAGIAPSQLHDKLLPANSSYEWTQVFGGVKTDVAALYDEDYHRAVEHLGGVIECDMSAKDITSLDKKLEKLADIPVTEDKIIHTGSGFGAVEAIRMAKDGDGTVPASMCFPEFTIGKKEYPWCHLIEVGVLPDEDVRYYTPSFMTSDKWLAHITASFEREGGRSWYSLMHYGIAVYDGVDNTKYATEAYSDEDCKMRTDEAERAWLASIEEKPSYLAYRNLAVLENQRDNIEKAKEYYEAALKCDGAFDDYALASEYLELLLKLKKYDEMWALFTALPESCARADRIRIAMSGAALKLGKDDFLDEFFSESHYDIREGEDTMTDTWFERQARKWARERGIEPTEENIDVLIDEAWENAKPPVEIDFRQSYIRKDRYRV